MGKLIAKTAGITLACLIALLFILFGVFTIFFPSVMVEVTDFCGMDKAAARYAVSVYERSNGIDDLADVVERAYFTESWDTAADYGERLMARADYEEYCRGRDEADADSGLAAYAQYISGIVAVSQYSIGEEDKALETAFALNSETFTRDNAAVTLAMTAVQREDTAFAARVLERLKSIEVSIVFEGESAEEVAANYNGLVAVLENFCGQ